MSGNYNKFFQVARTIQNTGIAYRKDKIESLNWVQECNLAAQALLGKDMNFLDTGDGESAIRLYIRDVFGSQGLESFYDSMGTIVINMETLLLFYYKMKALRHKELAKAEGLVYLLTSRILDEELQTLKKSANRGRLNPSYIPSEGRFTWRRCPSIMRKYTAAISVEEGYTGYVFDRKDLSQFTFLMAGLDYTDMENEAEVNNMLKQAGKGLLIKELPLQIENHLVGHVVDDMLDSNLLNGDYNEALNNLCYSHKHGKYFEIKESSDVTLIRPLRLNTLNLVMEALENEARQTGVWNTDNFKFNHISTYGFGFMLKDGVSLEEAFPTLHMHFNQVNTELPYTEILNGGFL